MRRKIKIHWLLLPASLIILIICLKFIIYHPFISEEKLHNNFYYEIQNTLPAPGLVFYKTTNRHTTKSLFELNKLMDKINRHFLFFNLIPYSGGEIIIWLLQKMQGLNNYRHIRLKGSRRQLNNTQQENLVSDVYEILRNNAVPISIDRNVFFTNFTLFRRQSPTYLTLIRNPINKLMSRLSFKNEVAIDCFNKNKKICNYQMIDLSIPYFCGHDPRCLLTNNQWAFETAKNNIEKYFPVVGILEEFNTTLDVLENHVSYFFKGVRNIFKEKLIYKFDEKDWKIKMNENTRIYLKEALSKDYELYEWLKSRLFQQLRIITKD